MGGEAPAQGEVNGRKDHGEHDDGQDHVADQDGKIDGPNGTLPLEQRIALAVVVVDVVDEEESREDQRTEHQLLVQRAFPFPDRPEPSHQEQGADGVEERVERREIGMPAFGRALVEVDEPDQETHGRSADGLRPSLSSRPYRLGISL